MTSQKDRYFEIVRRGIEKAQATDTEARQRLYERLRAWNDQVIAKRPDAELVATDLRQQLDEAIFDYETSQINSDLEIESDLEGSDAGPAQDLRPVDELQRTDKHDPSADASSAEIDQQESNNLSADQYPVVAKKGRTSAASLAAALVAGMLLGGGAMYLFASSSSVAAGASEELAKTRPLLDATEQLLRKARDEITAQQKSAPEELTSKAGQKFVGIEVISPALRDEAAKLPVRPSVIVRANGTAYKVLAATPLCTAAKLLEPGLVDSARDKTPFICSHIGYWNEAGAKF